MEEWLVSLHLRQAVVSVRPQVVLTKAAQQPGLNSLLPKRLKIQPLICFLNSLCLHCIFEAVVYRGN